MESVRKNGDKGILYTYFILSIIGIIMIYSASMISAYNGALTNGISISDKHFVIRQSLYFMIGSFIVVLMSNSFNIDIFKKKN
ncbi:FtsW/RodA/SpoVE family cell cycle protein, partial [Mammaliicoccus sciuri]